VIEKEIVKKEEKVSEVDSLISDSLNQLK